MNTSHYTIGIVCSGNTCRSPITGAWLRQLLDHKNFRSDVTVWTAGLNLRGRNTVHEEPLIIAQQMGMSEQPLTALREHRARDLAAENQKTDLLVWITDPDKINVVDDPYPSRSQRIQSAAKRLGATVLVIPEPDHAWEAKDRGEPENEVMELYRDQAIKLREWVWIIYRFIPDAH